MMSARRFVEAFGLVSLLLTLAELLNDRGGGDYFFSLVGLVLLITIAPYVVVVRLLSRPSSSRTAPVGQAATAFGLFDVCVRTPALLFPDERLNGTAVLWLPVLALIAIPALAAVLRLIPRIIPTK